MKKYIYILIAFFVVLGGLYFSFSSFFSGFFSKVFGNATSKASAFVSDLGGSDNIQFSSDNYNGLSLDNTSLSDSEISSIALKIRNALSGFTEDEEYVLELLRPLNALDFLRVSDAFGLVNLIPIYSGANHFLIGKREMFYWLVYYLDSNQVEELQISLIDKNI